jgi:hypothetical protein
MLATRYALLKTQKTKSGQSWVLKTRWKWDVFKVLKK